LGAAIGVLVILLDRQQEARGRDFRLPVLAVALGIYLPLKLSAAICVGGVISAFARSAAVEGGDPSRRGLLFAAGLITGEALMGIMLAIPIALAALWPSLSSDPFAVFESSPLGGWPGLVIVAMVGWALYRIAIGPRRNKR
jgi:uncharacterized oligopeptide transporter (OPT) family protein